VTALADVRRYVLEVAQGLDPGSRYVSELLAVIDASTDLADYDARISDPERAAAYRLDGAGVSDGGRGLSWLDDETWAGMDIFERTLANLVTAETRMMFRFEPRDLALLEPSFREVSRGGGPSILCVPCSTGKEVFSYAILALRAGLEGVRVQGVDRQRAYVERARTGKLVYHWRDREFEDADRFLEARGPREAIVREAVLARCSFETGDLLAGALPAGPFDLVACRNLLGYFRGEALVRAISNLDARTRQGGLLLLDPFVLDDPALALAPRWLAARGYRRVDPRASFLAKP
jgi:chemotaxis protein methyltransferase CheR